MLADLRGKLPKRCAVLDGIACSEHSVSHMAHFVRHHFRQRIKAPDIGRANPQLVQPLKTMVTVAVLLPGYDEAHIVAIRQAPRAERARRFQEIVGRFQQIGSKVDQQRPLDKTAIFIG